MGDYINPTDNNFVVDERSYLRAPRHVDIEDLTIETDLSNLPPIVDLFHDELRNNEQNREKLRLVIFADTDEEEEDDDDDDDDSDEHWDSDTESEDSEVEDGEDGDKAIREQIKNTVQTINMKNQEKDSYLKTIEEVLTLGRWSQTDECLELWLNVRKILLQPVKAEQIGNMNELSGAHLLSSATRAAAMLWKFLVFHQSEDYPIYLLSDLNKQNLMKKTLRFLTVLEAYPKCIKFLKDIKKAEPDFYEIHQVQYNSYMESL